MSVHVKFTRLVFSLPCDGCVTAGSACSKKESPIAGVKPESKTEIYCRSSLSHPWTYGLTHNARETKLNAFRYRPEVSSDFASALLNAEDTLDLTAIRTGEDSGESVILPRNEATALEGPNCLELAQNGDSRKGTRSIEKQLAAVARVKRILAARADDQSSAMFLLGGLQKD